MAAQDEVTRDQYQRACIQMGHCADALKTCSPDEAVEHWLPLLTREVAVVFSYVGSNMTARHVPRYAETVAALQRAKDVTPAADAGTLAHTTPQKEE